MHDYVDNAKAKSLTLPYPNKECHKNVCRVIEVLWVGGLKLRMFIHTDHTDMEWA